MITLTTRRKAAVALMLAALMVGCGRGGGGDDDDVASIDENAAQSTDDDSADEGGGATGPDSQEFQDAMLAYAECMRDHGIDMPDPEFTEDGGVRQTMTEDAGAGPDSEEFQAADEACQPLIEDAMPEPEDLSPEEVAERQDQLLEMAQCMRDKGYDMPDPQVDSDGRVRIERRGTGGDNGPGTGPPEDEEQFEEDMEACNEQAGVTGPAGGATTSRGSDG